MQDHDERFGPRATSLYRRFDRRREEEARGAQGLPLRLPDLGRRRRTAARVEGALERETDSHRGGRKVCIHGRGTKMQPSIPGEVGSRC